MSACYGLPMGRENRPLFAWYGDMELVPHLWEALKAGPLDVVVEFHPPMTVDAVGGRKALADAAEADRAARTDGGAGRPCGPGASGSPHHSETTEEPELAEAAA